jgi:hypothetical protein
VHTLKWNADLKRWIVMFVTATGQHTIGYYADGQSAADLVNSLNGGQPATVTEARVGKLGVSPQPSDEELLKQLGSAEAAVPVAT